MTAELNSNVNELLYAYDRSNSLVLPTTPYTDTYNDALPFDETQNWTLLRNGTLPASTRAGFKGRLAGPFHQLKRTPTWQEMLRFKTIGWLGSISLLSNNIVGPGLITVPLLYQTCGWLIPTVAFLFYALLATLASLFTVEAMQSIPGNRRFKGIVEFSTLVSFYFGKKTQYLFQMILFMALQATNIASIIISAQTFDNLIIVIFHKTCGVVVNAPDVPGVSWYCVDQVASSNSPFGNTWVIFSFGLLVTMVIIIPLGLLRIADNIWVQTVSLFVTLIIFISWLVNFGMVGLKPEFVPVFSPSGQSQVIGTVLFNFAFVTTTPSWINVKSPRVSIQRSTWLSSGYTVILYILVGWLGGMAYELPPNGNILTAINSSSSSNVWSQITAYLFPIATLLTSIPIFVIVVYQNLIQNEICKRPAGIFLSAILPFLIVIPFQSGSGLQIFVNWSSLLFTSTANFILPFVVYLKSLHFSRGWKERHGAILTHHQRQLLLLIHPSSRSMSTFLESYNAPDEDLLRRREAEFEKEAELMRMAVLARESESLGKTPVSGESVGSKDVDDYFGVGPWSDTSSVTSPGRADTPKSKGSVSLDRPRKKQKALAPLKITIDSSSVREAVSESPTYPIEINVQEDTLDRNADVLPAPLPSVEKPVERAGHSLNINLDRGMSVSNVNAGIPSSSPYVEMAPLTPLTSQASPLTPTIRRSTLVRALSTLSRVSSNQPAAFSRIGQDYDPLDPYDDPFEPELAVEVEDEFNALPSGTLKRRKTFWQKEVEDARVFSNVGGSLFGLKPAKKSSPGNSPRTSLDVHLGNIEVGLGAPPLVHTPLPMTPLPVITVEHEEEVTSPSVVPMVTQVSDGSLSAPALTPLMETPAISMVSQEKHKPSWKFWKRREEEVEVTFQSARFRTLPEWLGDGKWVAIVSLAILTVSVLINLIWTIVDLALGNTDYGS
jgi:hypothetical protein